MTTVLDVLTRGGTVTVGAFPEDVTTSTAADLLGVSRPTLTKLVAAGSSRRTRWERTRGSSPPT